METVNVDLLFVITIIGALTEAVKRKTMKRFPCLASFFAILLGLAYVTIGKYYFAMYENLNWLNLMILGLALGLAATGGYENIKNMFRVTKIGEVNLSSPSSQEQKEERMG